MYNDRKKLLLSKLSSAGYSGVVYRNNYDKVILRQKTTSGESFIIKYPFFDLDWKLINNTENVGNYLCYKAISVKKYKDSKGKIKEETFIAWYSPEIPVNFGPFVFGGLPGLILKLETEKEYFIANRISLKKLNNKIEKPQKGVEISLKKYDSIVMGLTKKIREN
jgi:GLPGLI family protein